MVAVMADCYIFGRAAGVKYGEELPHNPPCGLPEDALVYELEEEPPKPEREEPVFVRD